MDSKTILDTSNSSEYKNHENITEQKKDKNNGFKTKKCKVISYNKSQSTLDVKFDNYGIRVKNVKDFSGKYVNIKYKGEIGNPNFIYKL